MARKRGRPPQLQRPLQLIKFPLGADHLKLLEEEHQRTGEAKPIIIRRLITENLGNTEKAA